MTQNTATGNPSLEVSSPKADNRPYLWVQDNSDFVALFSNIRDTYKVMPAEGIKKSTEIPEGSVHTVYFAGDSSESFVKLLQYFLKEKKCFIQVYQPHPMELDLKDDNDVQRLCFGLMTKSMDATEWFKNREHLPINKEGALELAEVILKFDPDNWIELDKVRSRAKIAEYTWNTKIIANLEKKLGVTKEASKPKGRENRPQKDELPPASKVAAELAEMYRDKLAWESEYQLWRHYEGEFKGVWSEETKESVKALIHAHLRSNAETEGFSSGYVASILTILQSDLEVKSWNEDKALLPLADGVLNKQTGELLPHSPGYRFTWRLPYNWSDSETGCDLFDEFLSKITGNASLTELILCYMNAIVNGRADLQRYVELYGAGGTGKSTLARLMMALAGNSNTVSSQLKLLENNQFETAKFYRKRLAIFPDSERWEGSAQSLKNLTGQDPIRYERKGVQQCRDFIFEGMVVITANEATQFTDSSSGLGRRRIGINLNTNVPEFEGRDLVGELQPFMSAILKKVLAIPDERVTQCVKFTNKYLPEIGQFQRKQLIERNPMADWVNEHLVVDTETKTYIGVNDPTKIDHWLYPNYLYYLSLVNGSQKAIGKERFSSSLLDLLKNQLKFDVEKGKDNRGRYIRGIGFRAELDRGRGIYSYPISDGLSDEQVTAEPLGSDEFDGYDGFSQLASNQKGNELNRFICCNCRRTYPDNSSLSSNSSLASVLDSTEVITESSLELEDVITEEDFSVIEADMSDEEVSILSLMLSEFVADLLVEELADLRKKVSRSNLNKAAKKLTAQERSYLREMVEAKKFVGEQNQTGLVNGKVEMIESGSCVVILSEQFHSNEAFVYVKPVGSNWIEGIQVLRTSLQDHA